VTTSTESRVFPNVNILPIDDDNCRNCSSDNRIFVGTMIRATGYRLFNVDMHDLSNYFLSK
jgi:hypothetical protein